VAVVRERFQDERCYRPARTDRNGAVILRRAPIMRNIAISAVALLTAMGVFAIEMPDDMG
jgi:hypothetical protein